MYSKFVLTFFIIGALSVNVLAIPVPEILHNPGVPNMRPTIPIPPLDPPALNSPAQDSLDTEPGLRSKALSKAGAMLQTFIPQMTVSMFSGFVTHKLTGSDNSDWGSTGPHSDSSTNTNSSTSNTRRDLGPDPASLYMAVRTPMDDRNRAPSDDPVRPKRESELESESAGYTASHPVFKREPVSEDGVLGLPCSLLKRGPEPEPLKDSRHRVHPHGQAPNIPGPPRLKHEPQGWEGWGTNVGDHYG